MTPPELPRLIEPQALAQQIAARTASSAANLLLVDVSRAETYRAGHIPGSIHIDPGALVAGTRPAVGKLPSSEQLATLCRHIGLTPDSWVVACDDEGGGWAGRLIWTLEVIGFTRWSYLNGGVVAWQDAALPLTTAVVPAGSATFHIDQQHALLPVAPRVTIDELLIRHVELDVCVWDARSAAEFRGERSGSQRAGRIPGAVHLDWLALMDPTRALRLRDDLPSLLASHGITPDKEIITHCQSHHRSGLSYLVARLLNYPRIRAYDGSWSEWGNRDDTPIATGAGTGRS